MERTMSMQITYDAEIDLAVPAGALVEGITVRVSITPLAARALIYGTMADGNISYSEIQGGVSVYELPYASGKVWVKYLSGLETFEVATLGYRDRQ